MESGDRRHLATTYEDPAHREIAAQIAALWAELFDDPELVVGGEDNFFTLGGSSRLALQLVSRLNDRFAIRLNLLTLVDTPVFKDLVARVAALAALAADAEDAAASLEEGEL